MKGFIEVNEITPKGEHEKCLINVNHIELICGSTICLNLEINNVQDFVICEESYEEIKLKIEEATK